jgi:c-di-AMP phosphodiesterase-like protein
MSNLINEENDSWDNQFTFAVFEKQELIEHPSNTNPESVNEYQDNYTELVTKIIKQKPDKKLNHQFNKLILLILLMII